MQGRCGRSGSGMGEFNPPPKKKIGAVRRLSENFLLVGNLVENAKFGAKTPHFRKF